MTTLGDLTTELSDYLHSFTGQQEDLLALTQPAGASDLVLYVTGSTRASRGVVEIDDELVWVESTTDWALSIPAFGRGFKSTTAATHAIGAMVIMAPVMPRRNIRNAILAVQNEIYPQVYAVKKTTLTYVKDQATYSMPADCDRVLSVTAIAAGPSKTWVTIRHWRLVPDANLAAFPTGKAIDLAEGGFRVGGLIHVTYTAAFTPLNLSTDTLTGAGHSESHRDLLVYGAAYKLLEFAEVQRLNLGTAEAQARGQFSPPGAATTASSRAYGVFQQRLAAEIARLNRLHPPAAHFVR